MPEVTGLQLIFALDKDTTDDVVKGLGKENKSNRDKALLKAAKRWAEDTEVFDKFKTSVAPTAPETQTNAASATGDVSHLNSVPVQQSTPDNSLIP